MSDSMAAPHPDSVPSANGTFELVSQAARDGAADARAAAERAWSSAGLFLSRFVYTTSYTISYGVVFPAVLIARAVPTDNAAVRGLIDGAHAARLKVEEIRGTALAAPAAGPALAAS
jgi:hypothetical protein